MRERGNERDEGPTDVVPFAGVCARGRGRIESGDNIAKGKSPGEAGSRNKGIDEEAARQTAVVVVVYERSWMRNKENPA